MKERIPLYFSLASIVVLILFSLALFQAINPKWKNYQKEFYKLEAMDEPNAASKKTVSNTPLEIKQIMLPGLNSVDRCMTCHLGTEDPTLINAPLPYTYHKNIQQHPPSKFGCTVCHGGQGLATNLPDAHGNIGFWMQPLLPKDFVRASCGKCHRKGDIPDVPEFDEGRMLFDSHGCRGCHRLKGIGGTFGPDLTREGSNRRDPDWLMKHFLNPRSVSPGSIMPDFHFTERQAKALTFFMLSLTGEEMGNYYTSKTTIPTPQYGKEIFKEKNCITCHSIGNIGGKGAPDLFEITKRHSLNWLDEHIANPQITVPNTTMPAYDLDQNERLALVRFMSIASPSDASDLISGRIKSLSPLDAAIESGRMAFIHFGCVGCHGENAKGGLPNPNSQSGVVPTLIHVAEDYTKPEVKLIILKGKKPHIADIKKSAPPLYMPTWRGILSDEDINNIIEYLWSLKPAETESW